MISAASGCCDQFATEVGAQLTLQVLQDFGHRYLRLPLSTIYDADRDLGLALLYDVEYRQVGYLLLG